MVFKFQPTSGVYGHTDGCEFEEVRQLYHTSSNKEFNPRRTGWCRTHGQWAYEWPVKFTATFADGEEVSTITDP